MLKKPNFQLNILSDKDFSINSIFLLLESTVSELSFDIFKIIVQLL